MSVQKYDLMSCLKKAADQCVATGWLGCSIGGNGTLWAVQHLAEQVGGLLASRGKQRLTVSKIILEEGSGFKVTVY